VLALVVRGTASVIPFPVLLEVPWRQPRAPLVCKTAYDIAVTVREHRRKLRVLDALGDENRPELACRIRKISTAKPIRSNAGAISSFR
jgi:hypothetical protein